MAIPRRLGRTVMISGELREQARESGKASLPLSRCTTVPTVHIHPQQRQTAPTICVHILEKSPFHVIFVHSVLARKAVYKHIFEHTQEKNLMHVYIVLIVLLRWYTWGITWGHVTRGHLMGEFLLNITSVLTEIFNVFLL